MSEKYKSVDSYGEDEVIIEKSRFIGYCKPVETEEEANDFINEIKELHKTATHNCYAYVIGKNVQRFSDDGEPSHTAGMPILTTLMNEGLTNVCVVVTRYFGGVLLGKGGLVRAYTTGCKIALEKSVIVDKIMHYRVKLKLDYSNLGVIENYLNNAEIKILEKVFLEDVDIILYMDVEKYDSFLEDMLELTSGNISSEIIDSEYLSILNGKII
ncbi:YigZ family protein [Microaceticoccus formicicus]|uniref:YigZ family protein n=1 Tax=Microaceticoccus formicicus TaxID=3118105 RepID=UPI003CD00480|nr:YigZ family protein [Peptoniphilaceae bacterium AMB_02]